MFPPPSTLFSEEPYPIRQLRLSVRPMPCLFRKIIPTSDLRAQGDLMIKLRHHRFLLITHPRRNPDKKMESILSLIESGVTGLTLTLKSEDLKEFAHLLIEKAKEQLLPVMVSSSHEALLTKKEVLEKFNVCHTTLWNWERKGYLIPVKIGRKVSYRQADIERIIIERGKR